MILLKGGKGGWKTEGGGWGKGRQLKAGGGGNGSRWGERPVAGEWRPVEAGRAAAGGMVAVGGKGRCRGMAVVERCIAVIGWKGGRWRPAAGGGRLVVGGMAAGGGWKGGGVTVKCLWPCCRTEQSLSGFEQRGLVFCWFMLDNQQLVRLASS